jgi:hemerythrin superfamily protein
MDAIALLKEDHRRVKELFDRFDKAGDRANKTKGKLVDSMIEELSVHAAIEEQVFYPAVREAVPDLDDDILEAIEEHHIVKWTLSELRDLDPTAENYDAKVTVLIESVTHHVKEEEGELFPEVRKSMSRKDLVELGAQLDERKRIVPKEPRPRSRV